MEMKNGRSRTQETVHTGSAVALGAVDFFYEWSVEPVDGMWRFYPCTSVSHG
jgi:hypothetical protein